MAITPDWTLDKISKYGKNATFTVQSGSTYSPTTGATTVGASATYTHKVIEGEASEQFSRIDGVKDADAVLYASPSGMAFTPTSGMLMTYESVTYRIVAVRSWEYLGIVVLYEIAVKQ